MKTKLLFLILIFFVLFKVNAEEIFLKNGENIQGSVIEIKDEILTIESDLGYGVVRISKKDIVSIGFPYEPLNLTRRYAIGYSSRKQNSIGSAKEYNYRTDQFSLRTFLVEDVFLQYLLGYSQVDVKRENGNLQVSSFTSGLRVAKILFKQMNSHVYAGGGVGIVSIKDIGSESNKLEEQGTELSVIFGGEIFMGFLPNFGISGEIELSKFESSSIRRTDLNISAFPTFSIHYYF